MPRTDKSKKSALDALLAHVAPANAGRKPEAPTTQRQLSVVHETDPFAKYRLGAEGLKSVEPFADLNDHDRIVVLALVDLLKHGEHVGGIIESVHNWVGRF